MNGEKRKLMVIGKSGLTAFQGSEILPLDYKANKSTWLIAENFKD